jgi:hypothetical protein
VKYWIRYTDDTVKHFDANSDKEALHYFRMEGDHAYDYGRVRLQPPAPPLCSACNRKVWSVGGHTCVTPK